MNYFEEATLRLKQQLGMTQDKEVAEVLGLSSRAWAGRKKTGVFPETELLALSARRPGLALETDYIISGLREEPTKIDPGSEGLLALRRLQSGTQAIMRVSRELSYEPPMVWTALIQELMFSHGLTEAGASRIMETLKTERKAA